MASMNQHDMETMLGDILAEDESYACMLWAIFAANSRGRIALGQASDLPDPKLNMMPLNNAYAYVGATARHLNLVVVNQFKPTQVIDRFSIPFSAITRTEVRSGFVMGKVLIVSLGDARFQMELMSHTADNRNDEQKAAVAKLIARMVELNRR